MSEESKDRVVGYEDDMREVERIVDEATAKEQARLDDGGKGVGDEAAGDEYVEFEGGRYRFGRQDDPLILIDLDEDGPRDAPPGGGDEDDGGGDQPKPQDPAPAARPEKEEEWDTEIGV